MTIYVLNSIPPAVLTALKFGQFRTLTLDEARVVLSAGFVSAVGHADFAERLTQLLGLPVEFNRIEVEPNQGDKILAICAVPPYRLPEGERWSVQQIAEWPITFILVD